MGRIADVLKKIKRFFVKQTNFWFLLELAAVILIVTVAANYIFIYVGNSFTTDSSVKTWSYIYTNKADEPADKTGTEWNTANAINPMSKEKSGYYLHMRSRLEASDQERTLVVRTDYSPVKISLNGQTVYNNHYEDNSEYAGNSYNAVVLPASAGDTVVEISLRLPFSAEIETEILRKSGSTGVSLNAGLIFSLVLFCIGLIAAVIYVCFALRKKRKPFAFGSVLLLMFFAVVSAIPTFSHGSSFLNFPRFYNISIAAQLLLIVLFVAAANFLLKIKDRKVIFCLCLSTVAAILTVLPQSVRWVQILSLLTAILCSFSAAISAQRCYRLLNRRIQYAHGFFIMLLFLSALNLLCGIMELSLKYRTDFVYCRLIGVFAFLCFISFIFTAKVFSGSNSEKVVLKTARYDKCITKVAEFVEQMLSCGSEAELCRVAADSVYDLCLSVFPENGSEQVAFSVAKKENAVYREIYNHDLQSRVNYTVIENRCTESRKFCVFSETYFDFIFLKEDDFYIVFHFENIKDGLSSFFTSVLSTLYGCIAVVLNRFLQNADTEEKEIEIFTELAAEIEAAGGNNREHPECVAYYTRAILKQMGESDRICNLVSAAAMLHDIGKAAIPAEITEKAGLLSEQEREFMKKHTQYGQLLLSAFREDAFMQIAAVIAAEHHECYDGTGYNGIAGTRINEYARVVTVADTLDALTTKRSYKEAWPFDSAVEYIDANSGTLFDPAVVSAMHGCLDEIREKATEKSK